MDAVSTGKFVGADLGDSISSSSWATPAQNGDIVALTLLRSSSASVVDSMTSVTKPTMRTAEEMAYGSRPGRRRDGPSITMRTGYVTRNEGVDAVMNVEAAGIVCGGSGGGRGGGRQGVKGVATKEALEVVESVGEVGCWWAGESVCGQVCGQSEQS